MERSDAHALTQPGAALGRRQFLGAVAATGLAAGAGGLLAGCGSHPKAAAPVAARHHLLRGGNLKLGLIGGSLSDTLDPHNGLTYLDRARLQALYSPLVQLDAQARTEYVLAESITPKGQSPAEWIIRLRPGVTFHDGQKLTADDVIFTFRRIISNRLSGSTSLDPVDLNALKALDDLTVLVPMTRPYASFPEQLAASWYHLYIAPASLDPARPNGTGPFVFQSFSPGRSSVFSRNPHYFKTGLPHVATLTIMDFPDTISLQNALIINVIQGAGLLTGPQTTALSSTDGVRAVISQAGSITPFTMRVDKAPFNDVKVRQALRLVADRVQMVSTALDGYGTVAGDVFSPYDPDFDGSLRRDQDIPQARSLLKQAGKEDLSVPLVTSAITPAAPAMAAMLAQQAKAAGITITIQTVSPSVFFGPDYKSRPFAQGHYNYAPYLAQAAYTMLPGSPLNETHADNAQYNRWYAEANATLDPAKRHSILQQMQRLDFDEGGYLIPAFVDTLDAYSTKITGYTTARLGQPLSNFSFENFSFVS